MEQELHTLKQGLYQPLENQWMSHKLRLRGGNSVIYLMKWDLIKQNRPKLQKYETIWEPFLRAISGPFKKLCIFLVFHVEFGLPHAIHNKLNIQVYYTGLTCLNFYLEILFILDFSATQIKSW